jgi:putative membrane protein
VNENPKIDRQREHQANERTFLAWLRTAIALIGFGLAIARFSLFLRELQAAAVGDGSTAQSLFSYQNLGVVLVIVGLVVIVLSVWRYNQVFWQIEQADYRPSRLMVWFTAGTVLILGLLSIPFVLWRHPPPTPPRNSQSGAMRSSSPSGVIAPADYFSSKLANIINQF